MERVHNNLSKRSVIMYTRQGINSHCSGTWHNIDIIINSNVDILKAWQLKLRSRGTHISFDVKKEEKSQMFLGYSMHAITRTIDRHSYH